LFDVAASIDSLVIGERQILGQLREAYEQCREWGLTGDNIRLAMNQAVIAAKSVYSNTQIGDKPVSVVSLATQKLLNANVRKDARILVVGAGQTNQLVAKFLAKHQFNNVSVFNRTVAKAEQVAGLVEGNAHSLEELYAYEDGFDCMVVCTAVKEPIITKNLYQSLLNGDTERKVLIDLAIPHNVDGEVLEAYPVQYIEIEGLRSLAQDNLTARESEVVNAQAILENYLEEFPILYKQRQLELAMRRVPSEIKAVKSKAINEVFAKEVGLLDDQTKELIERMMAYMEKKCIGIPMKAARETFL
jgi:glutamyl-tRNA reductase